MSEYEEFKRNMARKSAPSIHKGDPTATGNRVIFGSETAFAKQKNTAIENIDDNSGNVTTEGTVFFFDTREIYGNRTLYKFDIASLDGEHAISCKLVLEPTAPAETKQLLLDNLKPGSNISIFGEAQYDKYLRETVLSAKAILKEAPTLVREDDSPEKRVELHLHTQMSAMDALTPIDTLIDRAAYWGHSAMAITDHGVVQSFPDGYKTAKKHDNFKLIYGIEAYLTDAPNSDQKPYHAVILAKNQTGLKNLYKLVTYSHTQNFYKKPRIDKGTLASHREGLLIGSACEQGELFRAIFDKRSENKIEKTAELYDYFEIMPLGNNTFMMENGSATLEDLQNINKKIIELGKKLKKLVVATGDVHFLDEKDAKSRAILQAGQGYSDADNQAPLFFRTTNEMLTEFKYLDDGTAREVVIENPQKIANSIEKLQPIPDGTFPPVLEGSEQQIQEMCWKRAREIYGETLPDVVSERIEKELSKIIKYKFSVMYLIAQKLVSKSLSDGYIVGSRGSVGSSFVAFLCGITDVNSLPPHYVCPNCHFSEFSTEGELHCGADMPNKACPNCGKNMNKDGHDIPFETFLGFEGDKEPDIDLNFSGDYQPIAHKYVEELFGSDNVFRAGTISTLASRTAFGFVKKYMESRGKGDANSATINRLVQSCVGVKRTTGQHPGGLMILPKGHDIHEFCPVQHPADDKTKNVLTTHFDYHSISGRLLKLDILGHDDPTVIKMLEDLTKVSAKTIPLDDPETLSLFTSTNALGVTSEQIGTKVGTLGIPEFGTKFVRQMLLDTKPTSFSELVRISGLSHGTNVWLNNAQDAIKNGHATLNEAICTRDDIMTYLMYRGVASKDAFDIMERVRKGKKLTPENEKLMRNHKIPQWYIESCNKIEYMFPKAHAVAYVTMAFKIAWFKVHHPLAFYLAYLTVRADEFNAQIMTNPQTVSKTIKKMEAEENSLNAKDKNVLTILQVVREMFARGFSFLPVDLYNSEVNKFTAEDDSSVRPPLIAIPGLGLSVAETIKEARDKMPFSSVEDLKTRTKLNKAILELLEQMGCLENMEESDQLSFF